MKSKKIEQLINSGLSEKLINGLSEGQVNVLYRKLVSEVSEPKEATTTNVKQTTMSSGEWDNLMNAGGAVSGTVKKNKDGSVTITSGDTNEEIDEDANLDNAVDKDSGYDPYAGNSVGNDEGPSSNDGDNNADDGMYGESEIKEKAVSQQQQKFFGVVKAMKKGDIPMKGKAGEAAKEMTSKEIDDFASTPLKGLPKKVSKKENKEGNKMTKPIGKVVSVKKSESKEATASGSAGAYAAPLFAEKEKVDENFEKLIESRILALVEKHINPKMTKKELLTYLSEAPAAPVKEPITKPKTKPGTRPSPYKNPNPGTNPAPKANKEELKKKFIEMIMQVLGNEK